MRRRVVGPMVVVCCAVAACIDPFLGPEPDPDDPVETFDILWEEFDRQYSFFPLKEIDWAGQRAVHRPRVGPATTGPELLEIVSGMLDVLRDGHVNVFTDFGVYGYTDWFTEYPRNYIPNLVANRMTNTLLTVPGGTLAYGSPGWRIGYIHVPGFPPGMVEQMDRALAALDTLDALDALIVDLRHNGGGSDREARLAAGRLVDGRRLYRTVRYRNGPAHDDFTPHIPSYVGPAGPTQFTGPVALLTNRRTFSAAESFVLAVRAMHNVVIVGDTTGGGSGFPMYRELPNGWTYRIPRWIAFDADGRPFEGVGLAPDAFVSFDDDSLVDLILDRAIAILREEMGR
jgi:carboxyl-terminal processing protease